MRNLVIIIQMTCCVWVNAFADEVYKWTDKNGAVHYGEFPPVNKASKTIQTPSSKPAPAESESEDETDAAGAPAVSNDSMDKKKKMLEGMTEERITKREAKEKADKDKKLAEGRCNDAKGQLAILEAGGRISQGGADGKKHYLDENTVKQRTAEWRVEAKKWCKK